MTRTLVRDLGAVLVLCLVASAPVQAGLVSGLHNTGQSVAEGGLDPYYLISGGPVVGSGTYATVADGFPIPPWIPNTDSPLSKWIEPTSGTTDTHPPDADYLFLTTFAIDPSANLADVVISGRWASDNGAYIRLNDSDTDQFIPQQSVPGLDDSYRKWTPFTLTLANSDLKLGQNELVFVVHNAGGLSSNPTGLRVEFDVNAVPEPATWVSGGLAALVAGLAAWRRRRAV